MDIIGSKPGIKRLKRPKFWATVPGPRERKYARYEKIAAWNELRRIGGELVGLKIETMSSGIVALIDDEEGAVPKLSDASLSPLAKVLNLYKELYDKGKLHFLSPAQSRADLDEAVASAEALRKSLVAKIRPLSI
jgi:hypothetical protein